MEATGVYWKPVVRHEALLRCRAPDVAASRGPLSAAPPATVPGGEQAPCWRARKSVLRLRRIR